MPRAKPAPQKAFKLQDSRKYAFFWHFSATLLVAFRLMSSVFSAPQSFQVPRQRKDRNPTKEREHFQHQDRFRSGIASYACLTLRSEIFAFISSAFQEPLHLEGLGATETRAQLPPNTKSCCRNLNPAPSRLPVAFP